VPTKKNKERGMDVDKKKEETKEPQKKPPSKKLDKKEELVNYNSFPSISNTFSPMRILGKRRNSLFLWRDYKTLFLESKS
jgi:hypothetical protein